MGTRKAATVANETRLKRLNSGAPKNLCNSSERPSIPLRIKNDPKRGNIDVQSQQPTDALPKNSELSRCSQRR